MGTLARVATLGAVAHSTTLVELGLDWGQAMLGCWRAIFAGQFDEGLRKFEALGTNGPSRIRAMQAFILALAMRHELPGESYPISPALEALPEEAWVGVITEWEAFAASRSMKTKDLIQRVSDFWRAIRLDTPWQLAFRKSSEDLALKSSPGQGRGRQGVAAEQ